MMFKCCQQSKKSELVKVVINCPDTANLTPAPAVMSSSLQNKNPKPKTHFYCREVQNFNLFNKDGQLKYRFRIMLRVSQPSHQPIPIGFTDAPIIEHVYSIVECFQFKM